MSKFFEQNEEMNHINFISCFMNPAVQLPKKVSQRKKPEVRGGPFDL